MKNFLFVAGLLLHSAPIAELCAFEEQPKGGYEVDWIGSAYAPTEKECLTHCYNKPNCSFVSYDFSYKECRIFKEGPDIEPIDPPQTKGYRLDRNLIRPNCPKLASLP